MADAPTHSAPPSPAHKKDDESIGGTIKTIIIAVLVAMFIRAFAFEPFNIPSGSMLPGLLIGDYLFVSKYTYGYSTLSTTMGYLNLPGRALAQRAPARGEVVVFKLPKQPQIDYIKRLIGLPGDVIAVRGGQVFINDQPLPRERVGMTMLDDRDTRPRRTVTEFIESMPDGRSYRVVEEYDNAPLDNFGPVTVPPGHYFFMGDNRDNSQDSRTPVVGFVPTENLVGPASVVMFSLGPEAQFYEFWKWPFALRYDRFIKAVR
jgi:signal peptidase I